MFNKRVVPLVAVFIITTALLFIFKETLRTNGFDWNVLLAGNVFIYLITAVSVLLLTRGLKAYETAIFLRNTYGAILAKLFACAAAAFIYILVAGRNLNKPALFVCMGLYLVYTFAELVIILKQTKKNNVEKRASAPGSS